MQMILPAKLRAEYRSLRIIPIINNDTSIMGCMNEEFARLTAITAFSSSIPAVFGIRARITFAAPFGLFLNISDGFTLVSIIRATSASAGINCIVGETNGVKVFMIRP